MISNDYYVKVAVKPTGAPRYVMGVLAQDCANESEAAHDAIGSLTNGSPNFVSDYECDDMNGEVTLTVIDTEFVAREDVSILERYMN